ncbi:hypothetical protein D3C71_2215460 [compost metagenome]
MRLSLRWLIAFQTFLYIQKVLIRIMDNSLDILEAMNSLLIVRILIIHLLL